MSAPLSLMTSCGSMTLPSDFDILRAVVVDDEAVGDDLLNGGRAARAEADEQRALEPAAMLVAALEVDVGRPGQLGPGGQHRLVARPGVEPDVEDVALAFERGAAARRAGHALGDELLDRPLVPGVGAVHVEDAGRALDERRRQQRFAALDAVDRRDRHAPGALARDAPVGPVGDHVRAAVRGPRPASSGPPRRLPRAPAPAASCRRAPHPCG